MYNDVVHGSITYLQCGRFTTSCQAWFSILGSNLSASCTNNAAVFQSASVDLNPHISNDNRNLVQGANYIATCTPRGFGLFGSLIFIYVYCTQDDHTLDYTSYNVNNNVVNDNGVLAWNDCWLLASLLLTRILLHWSWVASRKRLVNHWSEFNKENNLAVGSMIMWVWMHASVH
jgi:hypothetical protein